MSDDLKAKLKQTQLSLLAEKTRAAKATRELAELRTKQAKRDEDIFLTGDDFVKEHYFVGSVDPTNVDMCARHLALWHRLDPACDMNIIMHSGGGNALAGLSLFDQLTAYSTRGGGKHWVTVTIRGVAASMAGVLVQAADERVIGPESYLMIHELSAQTGGKIGEMKDAMKFYEMLGSRIANVYVNRSGGRTSLGEFQALWTDRDVWMDAPEALARGFVDRIG